MTWFQALIIAIVEGLPSFCRQFHRSYDYYRSHAWQESTEFSRAFIVNIQFGAILSVVVLYWKRFFQTLGFYYKLFVAFLPAAVIGFLAGGFIDRMLESVELVAVSLLLGGIVLLFVDKWFRKAAGSQEVTYGNGAENRLFSMHRNDTRSVAFGCNHYRGYGRGSRQENCG